MLFLLDDRLEDVVILHLEDCDDSPELIQSESTTLTLLQPLRDPCGEPFLDSLHALFILDRLPSTTDSLVFADVRRQDGPRSFDEVVLVRIDADISRWGRPGETV